MRDEFALTANLAAIGCGQDQALSHLYSATRLWIYGIARSVLGSPQDAEEIVGDVILYVWNNSHRYDAKRGSVRGWLAVIARNRAIDRIRRRRSMHSLDSDEDTSTTRMPAADAEGPYELVARFHETTRLHHVLTELCPMKRRLIEMAFFQGLQHEEIAARTGLPLGTVKSHIRRTLCGMRTALKRINMSI